MNHKEQIPKPEESLEELDTDATGSVDDFIKQLEEKEKDLHITADLTIEIEDSEYDPRNTPDFVPETPSDASKPDVVPRPAVAANQPSVGAKTRIYELEQEVESLKIRLSGLREERNEVQEKSDRRLKDFENYKYRMDRERRGAFIDQISNLAAQMLPVLDNLERAIGSVGGLKDKKSDEFQQFYDGIGLVHHQVNEIFSDMGVQPIATVGEPFDPNFHEAVAIEENSTEAPNTITAEMLRGYRIGNRVIRHSMVKVTAGAAPVKTEAAPETSAPPIPPPQEALPDPADIFDLDETLTDKE